MTAEGEECIVLERQANETYEDYFVRLHDNKANYGLTHRQIAALLNADTGQNYGESAYRKEAVPLSVGDNMSANSMLLRVSRLVFWR